MPSWVRTSIARAEDPSPLLAAIGGVYLKDDEVSVIDDEVRALTADSVPSEVSSSSIDPQAAERLGELSERLLRA